MPVQSNFSSSSYFARVEEKKGQKYCTTMAIFQCSLHGASFFFSICAHFHLWSVGFFFSLFDAMVAYLPKTCHATILHVHRTIQSCLSVLIAFQFKRKLTNNAFIKWNRWYHSLPCLKNERRIKHSFSTIFVFSMESIVVNGGGSINTLDTDKTISDNCNVDAHGRRSKQDKLNMIWQAHRTRAHTIPLPHWNIAYCYERNVEHESKTLVEQ